MTKKRFIEEEFPTLDVGDASISRKKNNISSLHVWWARRPLAASRASIYASLIDFTEDKTNIKKNNKFIKNLAEWDNTKNLDIILEARNKIAKQFNNTSPKILDPFSGGGAIPLEGLRLGCKTYASDYNPISLFLLKCTLEFPQKYATGITDNLENIQENIQENLLIKNIRKYGEKINKSACEELDLFYPKENNLHPYTYFWSRIINCQNPNCKSEIPLFPQYWLSKNKGLALYPKVLKNNIVFSIVGPKYDKKPIDFDPNKGSISNAIATCLVCSSTVDGNTTRKLITQKKYDERIIAVCLLDHMGKKSYRISNKDDLRIFQIAEKNAIQKQNELTKKWSFLEFDEFIDTPAHKTFEKKGLFYNFFPIVLYGFTKWIDLFNSRQKLVLLTFIDNINEVFLEIKNELNDDDAKIIISYITLAFNKLLTRYNTMTVWHNNSEQTEKIFAIQAIPMKWYYPEANPLITENATSFKGNLKSILKILENLLKIPQSSVNVSQSSATSLNYDDEFFDAVFTDPPYYDMVPYSALSDFFYIWDKRILGSIFPELFSTYLTPKSKEVIADLPLLRGINKIDAEKVLTHIKSDDFFENLLLKSFKEIFRVLKKDGVFVLVYAHKSTTGWETLINSLLSSGFVVTAAWPINTEMRGRMRAKESATLASSIYMVCRKLHKKPFGYYQDVKKQMREYLITKLNQLWDGGRISGADFFIAAIGSAIEVFGKYEKVVNDADDQISVMKLLNDTREIVTNYAIKQVLHSDFADQISQMTRFYILWRWAFGKARVPFDDARKMAHSTGIDIEHEWNKGFIIKESENIRVLGPEERKMNELENSHELIDIMHLVLHLWKNRKNEKLNKLLKEKKLDKSDMFKRVGQAISESLPQESIEKKWIDGFLTGFRLDNSSTAIQNKMDGWLPDRI